jgi:hypothetical protein
MPAPMAPFAQALLIKYADADTGTQYSADRGITH